METLAQRITRDGPLNELDAVGWIIRLAKRLEALHALGVAHGTVSPACVMTAAIDRTSRAAMTDMRRTPDDAAYHSPERLQGGIGAISPQDDAWALAATLYFTLTGTPPFGTGDEARQRIPTGTPAPLAVLDIGDDDLQHILNDAFSHEPGRRTANVNAFRRELEKWHPDPGAKQLPPLEDEDTDDGDEDDNARTQMRETYDEDSDPPPPGPAQKPKPAILADDDDDDDSDERTVMRPVFSGAGEPPVAPGRAPPPRPAAGMPGPPPAPRPVLGAPPAARPLAGALPRPAAGAPPPPRPVAGAPPPPRPVAGAPPPPRPAAGAPPPPRSGGGMPAPLAPPARASAPGLMAPPRERLESGPQRSLQDRSPAPMPAAFRAPAAPVRGPIIDDDSDDDADERTVMRASFPGAGTPSSPGSPVADEDSDDSDERTVMRAALPEASLSRPGAPPPAAGSPFPGMHAEQSSGGDSPFERTIALPIGSDALPALPPPPSPSGSGLLGPSPSFEMQQQRPMPMQAPMQPMPAASPFAMPAPMSAPMPQAPAKSRAGVFVAIAVVVVFAVGGAVFWFLRMRAGG